MVSSENENTRKNTDCWIKVFQKWAAARKVEQRLEKYKHQALDKTLLQLAWQIGNDYEPDFPKLQQAATAF